VRLVWLVDPESRTVRVYTSPEEPIRWTERDALDDGEVLPGFALSLKDLFARVPRPKPRRGGNGTRPAQTATPVACISAASVVRLAGTVAPGRAG
jgi:hypothetical protein